jgi:hypothetical protein
MLHLKKKWHILWHKKELEANVANAIYKVWNFKKLGLELQCVPTLPMEVILVTNHSIQILSGMHLSHYSGLVVVLDVPSDWGSMTRDTSLHNHHACQTINCMEPISRV